MKHSPVSRMSLRQRIRISLLFLLVAVCAALSALPASADTDSDLAPAFNPLSFAAPSSPLAPETFWFSTPASLPDENAIDLRLHRALGITLSPRAEVAPPRGGTHSKGTLATSLRSAVERVSDSTGRRLEFRKGDLILNISDTLYWRLDEPEITYRVRF
tara:strand:- start:54866 stop:55342 length:477 start_codon:yes stop_codon:yes gene_type:complete